MIEVVCLQLYSVAEKVNSETNQFSYKTFLELRKQSKHVY